MAAFAFALTSALKVASLDLCADEYLLALAAPAQIAAVSRLSHDPAESLSWRKARRFPAHRGRIEALIPLEPTLLVAVGGVSGRSTATIARRLGWKTLVLPYPQTPRDVVSNLETLSRTLGNPRAAVPFRSRLMAIESNPRPAVDAIFLSGGGQSVAFDGLGAQWMRLAGLRQRELPGGRATLETLALDSPSVLLRSDYRSGQLSLGQRWLEHPIVRRSAMRQWRTDGRPWTCGGPAMFAEIERLRSLR